MSNYQSFHNDLPSKVVKSFKGDISIDTETCLLYTSDAADE